MEMRSGIRFALAAGLLGCVALGSGAQTYTPPPPALTTLPPCPLGKNGKPLKKPKNCDPTIYPSEKKPKSADKSPTETATPTETPPAQQFPFPGEQPAKPDTPAAKSFPYPGSGDSGPSRNSGSGVPHDPAAAEKAADTPAGKAYPFPSGTTSDIPTDPDFPSSDQAEAGSGGSSSSSGSSASGSESGSAADSANASDAPGPKGKYDDDEAESPKLKEKGKKPVKVQTDSERVDEDLSIAKYYGQSGNRMGAYLRAKDAVKIQPEYAEAHFVLGQAAQRLGKKEEAAAEFTAYLKLAPDGDGAKAAEKALDTLR